MSSLQKKSLLNGIAVLGFTGIVCKLIGVLYRIPLAWLVHEVGLGLYQLVFPTYALLLTISSAGIPVAISKMVSAAVTQNDIRTANKIFKIALRILIVVGIVGTVLMLLGADYLSWRVGNPKTKLGFMAIAPSLFLVCVMSAFRGYIQGLSDMKPTAISQLIEQVSKVLVSLPLSFIGLKTSVELATAMALFGISISEFLALIYMVIKYRHAVKAVKHLPQDLTKPQLTTKTILSRLLNMAIPITLGAMVVPLSGFVDSTMLVNRLCSFGMDWDSACGLYGLYSGLVITLINLPTALAIAISMSLVPSISSADSENNRAKVQRNAKLGLRFAFLIGLPCSFGMSVLAKHLLHFFYSSLGDHNIQIAANLLEVSSFTILLFMVVQATSGILQGLHKERIPMYTLFLGVVIKIIFNYYFVGKSYINIYGAPFASLICYTISTIPNIYYVNKYCGLKFDVMSYIVRPGLASLGMAVVLFVLRKQLPFGRLSTIVLVFIGIAVFFALAILTKAISKDDLNLLKHRGKKHA